jgi:hypothetical protein
VTSAQRGEERYRVPVRLGRKDRILLDRLVAELGKNRNQMMTTALRHFYWTVMVKDEGVYISLPPDVFSEAEQAELGWASRPAEPRPGQVSPGVSGRPAETGMASTAATSPSHGRRRRVG